MASRADSRLLEELRCYGKMAGHGRLEGHTAASVFVIGLGELGFDIEMRKGQCGNVPRHCD